MSPIAVLRGWRGPSLALQILALLLGGLIVAQIVTLFLTLVLPPAPPAQYNMRDIAAALGGDERAKLTRLVRPGPPDLSGPGWLGSARSSEELAGLLGADPEDVRLAFYTPLPFAGTAGPPPGVIPASFLAFAQAGPGGGMGLPQGAGMPGGGFPGGGLPSGMPGGGFPGGGQGGFPGTGTFPGRGEGGGFPRSGEARTGGDFPGGAVRQQFPRGGGQPGGMGGMPGAAGGPGGNPGGTGGGITTQGAGAPIRVGQPRATVGPNGPVLQGGRAPTMQPAPQMMPPMIRVPVASDMPRAPVETRDTQAAPPPAPRRPIPEEEAPVQTVTRAPAAPERSAVVAAPPVVVSTPAAEPAPRTAVREPAPVRAEPHAVPIARPSSALFGLAPAPFVEGDFVAARRLADGRWAVVQPAAEGFPNAWQRRVGLWFLIAFAIVAPLGWMFARRLSGPLDRFADAAAQLGRDPSAAIVALDGPAEIGRAAHAFNLMQNRLRSFVDDRTAMVGAISHDLRTPLTRLRFRMEEVEDDAMRDGMLEEVVEMEEMIASVLAFIRDASTPGVRERLDLRTLVDDVAEDAAMVGGHVTVEATMPATVEVDVLGMRRLLANLVENALKYGERARIRLEVGEEEAIAAVIDDGPGLPDEELELVFQPFYRTAAARASDARGTGLGLAVCRSIARAHGGDVRLSRSAEGFKAEVRVPLVYESERLAA
ncbi:ATP-binding protein [Sphingomonas naphthae]|uniref:histidine kinase n=1 Tax=Sphingomonas naphthae TaxID=1813468 RepID=A0ABY7TI99_9SPHN|nr:ATP-binding protein [Sphingomonas naphthae]WCT72711.1 ATP-binding protein [Sphingomonas naphthae]